jgi:hypothetical protein
LFSAVIRATQYPGSAAIARWRTPRGKDRCAVESDAEARRVRLDRMKSDDERVRMTAARTLLQFAYGIDVVARTTWRLEAMHPELFSAAEPSAEGPASSNPPAAWSPGRVPSCGSGTALCPSNMRY